VKGKLAEGNAAAGIRLVAFVKNNATVVMIMMKRYRLIPAGYFYRSPGYCRAILLYFLTTGF
jgi:hypothetical protein